MNISYSDLRVDDLMYKIIGETIYIKEKENVYKVDFSKYPDGTMIEPISYLITNAKRENGQLYVTLRQPINEIGELTEPIGDFNINKATEINIKWKTKAEIEEEKNKPKELSTEERLKMAEETILFLMDMNLMGGM